MTQVETRDTVDVDTALSDIEDRPTKAIAFNDGDAAAYVRMPSEDDVRTGWLVDAFVDAIGKRRTFDGVEHETVREAVFNANQARIVPVNDTPFSPVGEE